VLITLIFLAHDFSRPEEFQAEFYAEFW